MASSREPAPAAHPSPAQRPAGDASSLELLAAAQRGDAAAEERFVAANVRLVQSIVMKFLPLLRPGRGIDLDDLFQVGCLGLLKAMRGFDLERSVRFSTYAVPVIAGEIRRCLREQHPVRVSRGLHDLAVRVLHCRDQLAQQWGRSPSVEEVAGELGISREEVAAALGAVQPPVSLEAAVEPDGGEGGALLTVSDDEPHDVGALVDSIALRQLLAGMEEQDRRLVTMRFVDGCSQTAVAAALGVSQAYVSRRERRILARLRRLLHP